jgi:hypothetical protein
MKRKYVAIINIFIIILTGCNVFRLSAQNPPPSKSTVESEGTSIIVETPLVRLHPIGDGGFLSDEPCSAPCFLEILPGETLFSDVKAILSKRGYADDCFILSENILACPSSPGVSSFAIGANQSGKVSGITFFPDKTIHLDDVLNKYGEPSQVVVGKAGIPEDPTTFVKLLFDTIQARITLTENFGIKYTVLSTSEVHEIEYFDPLEYSTIKEIDHQPWKGYSTYKP